MIVQNWFNVTTWADRDWKLAQACYWDTITAARAWGLDSHSLKVQQSARKVLDFARADYRHRIIGWYLKLCLPMQPGDRVPRSVAELLAEAWDVGELGKYLPEAP